MSAPIRIAIRADAGRAIGTGHFARASAVAEALTSYKGTQVLLLTSLEGAELAAGYFGPGTSILTLPSGDTDPSAAMEELQRVNWIPEAIYLDHYGQVGEWEAVSAATGIRLLVLDDLVAARRADVIVRPHGGGQSEGGALVLRGPAYLPLSSHITSCAHRGMSPSRDKSRLKLLVCFGGSDPNGTTEKALQALATVDFLDVDVVIGPRALIDAASIEAARRLSHIELHWAPSQEKLAQLMSEADFALGAGGVMLWERLYLGIPSLVLSAAQNQRPQIDVMTSAGSIRFLGDDTEISAEKLTEAIVELAEDESARHAMALAARASLDGRGALRLGAWLRALTLATREVAIADAEDLLNWRADERNWQYNWHETEKPNLEAHLAWLHGKLHDRSCVFRIVTSGSDPVGVVRFDIDRETNAAHLSIYLVPSWHGQKMGLPVYLAGEMVLRQIRPEVRRIFSRIHAHNQASEQLHRDAGFEVRPSKDRVGWLEAIRTID